MTRFTGPLLLSDEYQGRLVGLDDRLDGFLQSLRPDDRAATDPDFWPRSGSWMEQFRPYLVRDGVLHIPVKGVLLNDFPYHFGGWATGYEYVRAAMERGMADGMVREIALRVDSGGGMVTGCFETAAEIRAARGLKRVTAWVEHAYSAAYALTSAAGNVVVAATGGVGSIGVITAHYDLSGAYAAAGIKKTYIARGEGKEEGREDKPLGDGARLSIEQRLAATYDIFVGTVAKNRGLSEQAVRGLGAADFPASKSREFPEASTAIEVGLADRVGSHDDALLADVAETSDNGDDEMADQKAEKTFTEAEVAAQVATARDAARAEGVAAERARIGTILGSDAAKTRPAATKQAIKLGLDEGAAAEFLAALPEEKQKQVVLRDGAAEFRAAQDSSGLSATVETEDTVQPKAGARGAAARDRMKARGEL